MVEIRMTAYGDSYVEMKKITHCPQDLNFLQASRKKSEKNSIKAQKVVLRQKKTKQFNKSPEALYNLNNLLDYS